MNKQKHNGVLKNISPKCQWGFRPTVSRNGLVSIGDHEFVTAVGSRMVLYENNNQQKRTVLVDSKFPDVLYVTLMVVSPDRNYLATLVRMKNDQNTANVLIYQIGDRFKSYYKPSQISFENSAFIDGGAAFEFTSLAFCHDSQFIACATNVPSIGVLIYERRSSKIYQRISTDDAVISVTFHPEDSSKICTTGHGTLFKFWRYTSKSVHATPVTGLRSGNYSYTCHAWITTSEATVVGATNEGFLALVQGSEQTAPIQYAFGAPFQMNSVATPVMDLVVNGDVVFAVSQLNLVAVYEVRRNLAAKGSNKLSASLHLLARYKLINVDRLYGLQLCLHDSLSSFQLVGVSSNMMFTAEIISEKDVAFGSVQMPEKDTHAKRGSDIKEPSIYWIEYSNEKVIQRFHSGNIDSFALSGQTNSFISSSYEDQSIRVWDYDKFHASFDGSFVVESFLTRDEEMPFVVVMHPSGLFVACGFENDVREYAITDSTLDSVRKISTRDSYTGPTGAPYMVTQPVSIIRYSHGGHLMLVVTGKLVQIFHLYRKNYATSNTSGKTIRIAMLTDNNAAITDAAFTDDDAKVITTAADGAVYSWIVGTIVRDGEFLQKGVAATRIAVGRCTLEKGYEDIFIACFDNQADNLHFASEVVRKRKQSSMMTRRISQAVSTDKGIDGKKEETPSISLPAGAKSFADFSRKGSVCDGEGLSFLGAVKSANTIKNVEKKSFLAVWTNNIGVNASIICTEVPVRAVAIGESEGPDKTSLCVLGMVDGSVVITTLPLPTIILRVNETVPVNISSSVSITHGSITLGGRRNRRRSAIIANDDVFAAESANSSQNGSSKDGTSAASVSVASSQPDMRLMYSANQTASPHMQQAANTATVTNNPQSQPNYLDLSQCAVFNLHVDAVTHTAISTNGMWIFSVGVDGIIFMLATSRRGQDLAEFPETSKYLVIDRLELQRLRGKLSETDTKIELLKKDHELLISKLVEDKNKHLHDVETKLKKEIQKREDTIFHGRAEYLALLSSKKSDVAAIEKQCADAIAELELSYERKFAQDSLYLNKMKQAYDEYVLHTRMDLEEMQKKTTAKVDSVEKEKLLALKEAEKQKKAVLQYFEFLKLRNGEVINSIEDQQVEERCRMKEELEKTTKALKEAQQHKLTDLAQTHIREQKLQVDINNKEIEIMTLKADVDWANNRILNLENSLQQATAELKLRSNDSERWEYKSGELQQKIVDLERIRKALTTQLHNLRQELGPKEEKLVRDSERLQEMEREYEVSLQAIAEKEKSIAQKSESINLLQKQVRELRYSSSRKDAALRRSATLFDEYRYALQQAYFSSEKRTVGSNSMGNILEPSTAEGGAFDPQQNKKDSKVPTGEVIEIIAQNEGMKVAFKRLKDILTPYLKDDSVDLELRAEHEAVQLEQERHMQQLHRNVSGLRANLDIVNIVSATKVQNHLVDNQNLLKEVNNLRSEVRNLSMENQRLVAKLTTTVLMRNKSFRSKEKTEFGSEMTNFQDYYDTHAPHSSVKTNSDAEYSDDKPKLLTASLFGESGTEDASGPGNTSKQYQSLDKTVIDIPSTLKSKDSSRSEVSFFSVEEAASLDQVSKLSQTLPINASLDSKFGKDSKKNQDLSAEEKISQLISMNDREIKELNSQSKMSRGSGSKSANDVSSNFSKKKMPPQNLSASSSELNLSITSLSGGIADTLPFKKNDKKKSGNNKKALSFQKDRHVQLPSLNRN